MHLSTGLVTSTSWPPPPVPLSSVTIITTHAAINPSPPFPITYLNLPFKYVKSFPFFRASCLNQLVLHSWLVSKQVYFKTIINPYVCMIWMISYARIIWVYLIQLTRHVYIHKHVGTIHTFHYSTWSHISRNTYIWHPHVNHIFTAHHIEQFYVILTLN